MRCEQVTWEERAFLRHAGVGASTSIVVCGQVGVEAAGLSLVEPPARVARPSAPDSVLLTHQLAHGRLL